MQAITCRKCGCPVKPTDKPFLQLGMAYVDWWRCVGCARIITQAYSKEFAPAGLASALKAFQQL